MEDLIQQLIDRQLRDLRGAEVIGQLSLSDELVNEVLTEMLPRPGAAVSTPSAKGTGSAPSLDLQQLLSWMEIRKLNYRTEAGRTVLELNIGI